MTVWAYKIARDYGFAPNPFFGFCTVACCKPKIRRNAQLGDLVIGCGSSGLKKVGRVIYVMRVTEKTDFSEYWEDQRFIRKRPSYLVGKARSFGDNIYHKNPAGEWMQEDSHHSYENGGYNALNAERDLSADSVLISNDFAYWGAQCPEIPPALRNFEGDDLYPNTRDFRNSFSPQFQVAIHDWFGTLPRGRLGRPISWKG